MKVSKEVTMSLIRSIRSKVEPETVDAGTQNLTVFFLDDITLSFTQTERQDFYGLTFEALGRDFSIINNLELLVIAENDEGDEEGFIVEDELLVSKLEKFLALRTEILDEFGA